MPESYVNARHCTGSIYSIVFPACMPSLPWLLMLLSLPLQACWQQQCGTLWIVSPAMFQLFWVPMPIPQTVYRWQASYTAGTRPPTELLQ